MRRIVAAAILVTAASACTDIIPDAREEAYEYWPSAELSLHWPREWMPLQIWADPAGPLYEHVKTAITRWENALLYGEFTGILVADSNDADIIFDANPAVLPPEPEPELRFRSSAPQCTGVTEFDLERPAGILHLPVHAYITVNGTPAPAMLATCYRLTITHELGHALGILNHSINPADIMYANPVVDALSAADRQTMEQVFHSISPTTIVR